ncbi:hypothetical protein ABVT39_000143 [Epinephelus coioides]
MIPVWFPTLKDLQPEIECAHRIFRGGPRRDGERPQAFIFCCLRFSTRQAILREARKHPPSVGNNALRFAADFSDYTARHRRAFSRAMASAREKSIDAFLLYPAKIRVGQITQLFPSPSDVERFLEQRASPSHLGDISDDAPLTDWSSAGAASHDPEHPDTHPDTP